MPSFSISIKARGPMYGMKKTWLTPYPWTVSAMNLPPVIRAMMISPFSGASR